MRKSGGCDRVNLKGPGVVAVFLHAGHGQLQRLQLAGASLLVFTRGGDQTWHISLEVAKAPRVGKIQMTELETAPTPLAADSARVDFGLWLWHGRCSDGDGLFSWCAFDLLLRHIGCRADDATAHRPRHAPDRASNGASHAASDARLHLVLSTRRRHLVWSSTSSST